MFERKMNWWLPAAEDAKAEYNQTLLLRDGAKLIDDLCSAFKVTLLPDDQKVRDEMANAAGE